MSVQGIRGPHWSPLGTSGFPRLAPVDKPESWLVRLLRLSSECGASLQSDLSWAGRGGFAQLQVPLFLLPE